MLSPVAVEGRVLLDGRAGTHPQAEEGNPRRLGIPRGPRKEVSELPEIENGQTFRRQKKKGSSYVKT